MQDTRCDRPLAAKGLTSYRCKGQFGWIMIGARDDADALREARRSDSSAKAAGLQVWSGSEYVPVAIADAGPAWAWVRVHPTPFYRVWRYHPHAEFAVTGKRGIEQRGAVVDDFGNLIFVEEDVL